MVLTLLVDFVILNAYNDYFGPDPNKEVNYLFIMRNHNISTFQFEFKIMLAYFT